MKLKVRFAPIWLLSASFLMAALIAGCSSGTTRRDIEGVPGGFAYRGDRTAYPELYRRASEQLTANEFSAAEATFRAIIAKEPDYVDGYIGLGTSLLLQDQLVQAQQAYEQAIGIRPDSVEALIGMGSVHYRNGVYEKASGFYRSALVLEGTNPDALWGLAISLAALGQVDGAIANLERIRELAPGTALAQDAANLISTLKGN
ncbi:MAG: tetratricopeptide repeat protein [Anaerolineales bacterium]